MAGNSKGAPLLIPRPLVLWERVRVMAGDGNGPDEGPVVLPGEGCRATAPPGSVPRRPCGSREASETPEHFGASFAAHTFV